MKAFLEVFRGWGTALGLAIGSVTGTAADSEIETRYFLMLGRESPQTAFIVGFSDPEQVTYVRAVLQGDARKRAYMVLPRRYPSEGEFVTEVWPADRLRPGRPVFLADGINRNYFATATPAWSWHIGRVDHFADGCAVCFTDEPSSIEEWVVANPEQPYSGVSAVLVPFNPIMELGPALSLRFLEHEGQEYVIWVGVGLGYVYTLESTDDPVRGEWEPVPGGDWPLDVVRWPIDRSEPGSRFYRVRAEPAADPGSRGFRWRFGNM